MIADQERRWLWWFIFLVMGITTIPYLLGFGLQGENWRFTGFFFGVEDGNSYIAKMLSGAAGEWLFRTPYTAYPQSGMVAFLPYLLLGKLTAPPAQHEQLLVLFQLFRWCGGIAMIWATYRFIAHFIAAIELRRMGIVLAILGGGLGWLSVLGLKDLWSNQLPLEFYSPETFGFLSILGLPHLEMARALLLLGFILYLETPEGSVPFWRRASAGGAWLLAGLMQPLTVVTGWIVLLIYHCANLAVGLLIEKKPIRVYWNGQKKRWIDASLTVAISSPIVMYTIIAFTADPFLSEWNKQNLIISPPLGDYILAFSVVLPFILYAAINFKRLRSEKTLFLTAWIAGFPLLAYAPVNLQRRLPDGIWVVLVVAAMMGFSLIQSKRFRVISRIWLSSSLFSGLFFMVGGIFSVTQLQMPIYRPLEEVRTFDFIQQVLPVNSVVLAQYAPSNPLPAWAPVRTVIGHGPESANLKEIQPRVNKLLGGTASIPESKEFFNEFNIGFLLITPIEEKFDSNLLVDSGILTEVYNRNGYRVFKVNP